jgi:hypothetical protein
MFKRGQIVRNQKLGLGKVVELSGTEKVRVQFEEDAPPRLLGVAYLEIVESESVAQSFTFEFDFLRALPTTDLGKVKSLCELFISRMENRRSNCDDAGVAKSILKELETNSRLTRATYKKLASWCHTGASFQEGVDLAQDISLAIYGRVIFASDVC